ncbi:succinate--CoA ligase subunit beta, partial [bacterium]
MKIHEYQAKALLSEFGILVPEGKVAATPAEAGKIAAELGGRVAI